MVWVADDMVRRRKKMTQMQRSRMRNHYAHTVAHTSDPLDIVTQTLKIHEANTSLQVLNLGDNKVGDAGTLALAEALKATRVLCASCVVGL